MLALENAPDLRLGLQGMLEGSIEVALSRRPGGCLPVLGAVDDLPDNTIARQHLLDARRQTRELINTRLKRGQAEGELDPDTDTEQMAMFLHGVMQAISFQARDGASKQALNSLIEPALRAWLSVGRSGKP